MRFNDIKSSILAQFAVEGGNKVTFYIEGRPGGGKSSVAREIAQELCKIHGIPSERVVEFNPSLREPTDILGLPKMTGDHSEWLPPAEFYNIRRGTGPAVLIIEELSDAGMDLQNPMCRIILDRYAGNLALTDELYIIASGNRTEDKSGANRLSTKLGNRMRVIQFEESLDDWIAWAEMKGISPVLRNFLKWRPSLLSDFDPKRATNPTPRSWADVATIPTSLPSKIYFEHCAGSVGQGAASEWTGFMKIYKGLPDFDKILKDPEGADMPTEPHVLYAVVAKIESIVSEDNFSALYKYITRMPAEFVVMAVRACMHAYKGVTKTKEFMEFAVSNADVILG